jgi:hypothetical protein
MRTKIIATVATILAASAFIAIPAFADPPPAGGEHARPSYPIPAAEFKQHIDARLTKMRAHLEERVKTLPTDQAKEMRTNFDASIARLNAEVSKAIADGKVTKEEADAVRAASPHKGKGGGNCNKGGAKT